MGLFQVNDHFREVVYEMVLRSSEKNYKSIKNSG